MRVASAVPAMTLGVAFFLATVDAVPRISLERQMNRVGTFFRDGAAFPAAKDAEARVAMEAEIRRSSLADGSVGVFGTWHSLLLGYSGRHVALPVVASYEIWSPWTSRREREFLLGPEAPDYLLYTASPVSAEVAVTLARRYEEIERRPRYLLLRRRPQSLAVNKRVVFDATVDDRQAIAIPAEWRTGPAVAEVRYTKTLANTVISTIHQPPEAFLVLSGASGYVAKIRMNALLSGEGIVLSGRPGIWDGHRAALHGMRFGMLNDERTEATALGFEARGPAGTDWRRYFGSRIHVRIYVPEFW